MQIACFICQRPFHRGLINPHHIQPRHAGGSDEESNLIPLDPTCHQTLHRIAEAFEQNKPERGAMFAQSLFPSDVDARRSILEQAKITASHVLAHRRSGVQTAEVSVTITITRAVYDQLQLAASSLRQGKRRVSVPRLCSHILRSYAQPKATHTPDLEPTPDPFK